MSVFCSGHVVECDDCKDETFDSTAEFGYEALEEAAAAGWWIASPKSRGKVVHRCPKCVARQAKRLEEARYEIRTRGRR